MNATTFLIFLLFYTMIGCGVAFAFERKHSLTSVEIFFSILCWPGVLGALLALYLDISDEETTSKDKRPGPPA